MLAALLILLGGWPVVARGQDQPTAEDEVDGSTGLTAHVRYVRTGTWSYRTESLQSVEEREATGVGLGVAYRIGRHVAPYAVFDVNLNGDADLAGFTAWQTGLEGQLPFGSGVVSFGGLGIGRLSTSGGAAFTYGSARLGVAFHPIGGFRLRGSYETLTSLGGSSFRNDSMTVLDAPTRLTLAIGWAFGL